MSEYISTITLLQSPWNTNLTSNDFMIETETPIRLKSSEPWVILFYGEDDVSRSALNIWSKVAQITIGPKFGSCNLRNQTDLASKFMNNHHGMRWTNTLRIPYILAYNDTWPFSKYSGNLDQQTIANWALTVISGPCSFPINDNAPVIPTGSTGTSDVILPKTL